MTTIEELASALAHAHTFVQMEAIATQSIALCRHLQQQLAERGEPVAWSFRWDGRWCCEQKDPRQFMHGDSLSDVTPLYAAPPQQADIMAAVNECESACMLITRSGWDADNARAAAFAALRTALAPCHSLQQQLAAASDSHSLLAVIEGRNQRINELEQQLAERDAQVARLKEAVLTAKQLLDTAQYDRCWTTSAKWNTGRESWTEKAEAALAPSADGAGSKP